MYTEVSPYPLINYYYVVVKIIRRQILAFWCILGFANRFSSTLAVKSNCLCFRSDAIDNGVRRHRNTDEFCSFHATRWTKNATPPKVTFYQLKYLRRYKISQHHLDVDDGGKRGMFFCLSRI
jgi:hypothetical protein